MGVSDRVGPRWDEARRRATELAPKMVEYLRRVGPAFAKLAATARVVGVLGLVAAALIVGALVVITTPSGLAPIVAMLVIAMALAAPGVLVLRAGASLRELSRLPDAISASPDLVARNSEALAKVYLDTVGEWGEQGRLRLLGGGLWRVTKLVRGVLGEIPELQSVLTLVNPAYLASAAGAVILVVIELCTVPIAALVTLVVLIAR